MGEDECTYEIICMIDKENLIHVENEIKRKQYTTDTEEHIINLDKRLDFQRIYIDAGAGTLGVSILDHLMKLDQTKRKIIAINNRQIVTDREKGTRTRLLKEDLYNNLLALMEQRKIKLLDDDTVKESLRSVQYEYMMKEGQPTRIRIFGNYTHVAEGLIRAAYCVKDKNLNIWISSIKV